ncbi:MAG: Spy/CpxP family protein refolding chaperone [Candidatus Aminicenantes bacterium]|nr:Spy/CpxP family protein refolding chaperone [Candidatus Aminicenantes bacterium]
MRNKLMILSCLVLFLFLVTTILQAQPMRRPGWARAGLGPGLQEWLGLTSDQKSKIEALRKTHQEEIKAIRDKLFDLQKQLREARQDPKADSKKIDGLIDEIFKLRASEMKARIKHQGEIEKLLTKEQRDKLAQARERMSRFFPGRGIWPGFRARKIAPFMPSWPGFMMRPRFLPRWWW